MFFGPSAISVHLFKQQNHSQIDIVTNTDQTLVNCNNITGIDEVDITLTSHYVLR